MNNADLDSLAEPFLTKAYRLKAIIERDGLPFVLLEARRTFTRQQEYFMRGRENVNGVTRVVDKRKVITNARPGASPHNFGLANDYVIDVKSAWWDSSEKPTGMWDTGYEGGKLVRAASKLAWERYGRAVKEADLEWGGNWASIKDLPHSELYEWTKYRPANWQEIVQRELEAGR